MPKTTISECIRRGDLLVSDGAWGTMLQEMGLPPGDCPERFCLERPEAVLEVARRYVEAGADMIETNSFGGSRLKLAYYGLAERTVEINEAAARLSRMAAGPERWVIASIGPTGRMLITGETTEEELCAVFAEQAEALARGGADAVCIETMSDALEAAAAVRAAREYTELEIICTFTFDLTAKGEFRTMMGLTPAEAAKSAVAAGAHIVGANCGNGFERMIPIVREIRAALPDHPILVHANAGLPRFMEGKTVYPETPERAAELVGELVKAGANVIGGCCGTTPAHIRALKEAVRKLA